MEPVRDGIPASSGYLFNEFIKSLSVVMVIGLVIRRSPFVDGRLDSSFAPLSFRGVHEVYSGGYSFLVNGCDQPNASPPDGSLVTFSLLCWMLELIRGSFPIHAVAASVVCRRRRHQPSLMPCLLFLWGIRRNRYGWDLTPVRMGERNFAGDG